MLFSSAVGPVIDPLTDPSCVSSCAISQVISSDSRAAARGDRHFDKQSSKQSRVRWGRCGLAVVLLSLSMLGGFAPAAEAQTAHFSWAITPLGRGFSSPWGVAVDASGNVFVADQGNSAVKEIVAAGGYTTVNTLGSGFNSPQGVAVDANGNVFVADTGNSAVEEIVAAGGYTTVNTLGSGFSSPQGVAVDRSGNVFVADTGNNAVKEILAVSGSIPATNPTINLLGSGFSSPQGVAVDANGNVFVADTGNIAVEEIVAVSGSIPATNPTINLLGSGFSSPQGVAVDASGNVFVTDAGNNAVDEIAAAGGYTTVNTLGSGLSLARGVAVDGSGNVLVADSGNNAIKAVMTQGVNFSSAAVATSAPPTIPLTFTFDTGGTLGTSAVLTQGAAGLDFANAATGTCTAGNTYNAADTCILNVSFTPQFSGIRYGAATLSNGSGALIATAYVFGTGSGPQVTFSPGTQAVLGNGFSQPQGIAVDGSGNVFVADTNVVKEIPVGCGGTSCVVTLASSFSFSNLPGIAVDGSGNIYVADYGANKVYEILAAGGYTTVNTLGSGFSFNSPTGVAVDGSGNVFVADYHNNAVDEILAAGGYTTVNTLGGGFNAPQDVAVDGKGNVFVADTSNSAVKEIPPGCGSAGCMVTLGGGFDQPAGITVDGNGNIYIGDTGNSAVKQMSAGCANASCVVTLGSGFSSPQGVSVDRGGNVYVADRGNTAVKELDFADPPSVNFASTAVGSISSDSPQTVTVTNIGNATLTFPVPATGLNPSVAAGFTLGSSSTCPQLTSTSSAATLAPGLSCTNLISFMPTAGGSISGSLAMTDDHLNATAPAYATQLIALSGTATVGTPTISFIVPNHGYGDAPFTVSATSNSTGAFTYTVVSGPATISGSTVTMTGAGTVVLQASEAADSNYASSTQNVNFTVAAGTPTISFTVPNHTYGDAAFTVSAVSKSTGAFTYSVVSGPATIAGSAVSLTGAGTVVLEASQAADANYVAVTQNATFAVAATTPTISFTVPNHTYGDAAFTVSATSSSTGAFVYTVISGPATISGSTVTLTGAGTVVLSASQVASGNYAAAAMNATFTVTAGLTLSSGSGTGSSSGTATVAAGAAATFTIAFAPGGSTTYPDPVTFSVSGLPAGSTATFSPGTIPAGGGPTSVALTIQTSSQTARQEQPLSGRSFAPVALGFLLLPLAGMKSVRKRLRQMSRLTVALSVMVLSLGAAAGLSGCGASSPSTMAKAYTVVVTATDAITAAHSSINLTLNVQ